MFDYIKRRMNSYRLAFGGGFTKKSPGMWDVLSDLGHFCHANESCAMINQKTGVVDDHLTAMREGRREVWLRIQQHLHLSPQQLYALYTGQQFNIGDDDGR